MDEVPLTKGDQTRHLKIGSKLTEGFIRKLIDFLRSKSDCFAWSHAYMPRINPEIIMHKLQVDALLQPVRQKRRKFAPQRDAIINDEVKRLLGAGLIGCEFANDLAAAGLPVTVIDPADAPLSRLLPPEAGDVFGRALSDAGVRLRLGAVVQSVARLARGYRLVLTSGEPLEADLVVSAIGLVPRTALAREAGLDVADGIVTDAWCRTSVPDIFALGDCAAIEGRVRPYVLPIMHAARALAQCLRGTPTRVAFPVMPIVVKTPAIPAVVVAADTFETRPF